MFKHAQRDYHLYVKPGEAIWSIQNNLNFGKIWLKGAQASQRCPGHLSSSLNQQGDANKWEIGAGKQKGVKGGVLIRCHSVHHTDHTIKWLVKQGREGLISKKKVAGLLCQEDEDGSFLLSLMDIKTDVQQHVAGRAAVWGEGIEERAHKLSLEFVQWQIKQRMESHSEEEELGSVEFVRWLQGLHNAIRWGDGIQEGKRLGSVVLDFESQKQAAYYEGGCLLSLLDTDVQQEVATWNPETTEKIAHTLSSEFVQWLIKKRIVDGHWEGKDLGSVVWRKNKEGTVAFSLLDFETQKQVTTWNTEATEKIAHMQSLEFIQWIIKQKIQGQWEGKEVESIVWRKNEEGTVMFSVLDFETQSR